MTERHAVRIRVPATSANLGPGYDSFGIALGIFDEVVARRRSAGLEIRVTGAGARTVPTDGSHLVVRAAHAAFDAMGEPAPGLALECRNAIPHGSGQGSSAAAIVAGILLARALTPGGDLRLPDGGVLDLAARIEGHPDNVAPALLGGFTIAWSDGPNGPPDRHPGPAHPATERAPARAVRLTPHPDLQAVLLSTEHGCATKAARAAIPARVPHADAVRNTARAALLVHALTHDPALLFPATEDWLHQRYRDSVMPASLALVRRLRSSGLAAVLSGAGPTVLVLGRDLPDPQALVGDGFTAASVTVSGAGASVQPV